MILHKVQTSPCAVCGRISQLGLSTAELAQYGLWQSGEIRIQDAFPHWYPEMRELLMTGTHPSCWNEMTANEEDG